MVFKFLVKKGTFISIYLPLKIFFIWVIDALPINLLNIWSGIIVLNFHHKIPTTATIALFFLPIKLILQLLVEI